MSDQIQNTASLILERTDGFKPEIGIVLGSGLGALAETIDIKSEIEYKEIPDFPISTVEGHKGRFVFGQLGGKQVVAMQGRFHYYEGYSIQQVVFPIRVMKLLGIEKLFVSNAAGGLNPDFKRGDLMTITDHINLLPNPLVGRNHDELGPRFPDMNEAYDPAIRALADRIAMNKGIKLQHGVYVGSSGPSYETPAEYRYFRIIGGDATGMSTTPEVIAANHMGIRVFGISVITNVGLSAEKPSHEEVQQESAKASQRMTTLITEMIKQL